MYDEESLVMDNLIQIYSEDISVNEKIDKGVKGFNYIQEISEREKKNSNLFRKMYLYFELFSL